MLKVDIEMDVFRLVVEINFFRFYIVCIGFNFIILLVIDYCFDIYL